MAVHLSATRSTALWLLIGAVIVGGVLGVAGDRIMIHRTWMAGPRGPDRHAMRERLFRELHVTPTQRVVLDSIFEARARAESTMMVPFQVRRDSLNKATGEHVKTLLSPDQQVTFDKIIAKLHQHGPPGPPGGPPGPPPPGAGATSGATPGATTGGGPPPPS